MLFQPQIVDDAAIKSLHPLLVVQGGIPQMHKPPVFFAVHHLLGGKGDIHQILPQSSGQGPFEKGQHLLPFLLRHQSKGLIEFRYDLPFIIDIAPTDVGDVAFVRTKTAADFCNFFFIHMFQSPFCCH